MRVPPCPAVQNGYCILRVRTNAISIIYCALADYINTAAREAASNVEIKGGRIFANSMSVGASSDSNGKSQNLTSSAYGIYEAEYIKSFIAQKGTTNIPAGTRFTIYAIRA